MSRRSVCAFLWALLAGPAAWADLTIRHSFELKLDGLLPPEVLAEAKQQLGAAFPGNALVRIKGDKSYAAYGKLTTITDYAKGRITVLNPESRQFAALPLSEFPGELRSAQRMPSLPWEAARLFENMNCDVQVKKTGHTETVGGFQAEETLLLITLTLSPDAPAGLRLEMRDWIATGAEAGRSPALRELATYSARAKTAFDPASMVQKVLSQLPGLGEKLREPMQELVKTNASLVLKSQAALYVTDNPDPVAGYDMDLKEISTAPVSDAIFEVPPGYQPVTIEVLMKSAMPADATPPSWRGRPRQ